MIDFLLLIFIEMGFDGLYFKQGTMLPVVEPDEFFTYWNIRDTDEYVDNVPAILHNSYQVYFYCKEEMLLNNDKYLENKMKEFINKARSYGLVISNVQDIDSGLENYVGRMCSVAYAQHE